MVAQVTAQDEERAIIGAEEIAALAAEFEQRSPQDLLAWATRRFGARLALTTSFQAAGMVLLDMAWRIDPSIRVVTVDSGRLRQENHDLMERVRERYELPIAVHHPDAKAIGAFVEDYGSNAFYRSGALRLRCCDIRKVAPLTKALAGFDAWISGQRRDQSESRREIQEDRARPEAGRPGQAQPAGRLGRGAGLGLHPRPRRPLQRALRPGVHEHRLRPLHPRRRPRRRRPRRPLVVGGQRAEGVRHPLLRQLRPAQLECEPAERVASQ